ncbi:hypothetical protein KXW06_008656, partial [Aspergillus fumigatus]
SLNAHCAPWYSGGHACPSVIAALKHGLCVGPPSPSPGGRARKAAAAPRPVLERMGLCHLLCRPGRRQPTPNFSNLKAGPFGVRVVICRGCFGCSPRLSALERAVIEGENPVWDGVSASV